MSVLFCAIDASISCTGIAVMKQVESGKFMLVDKTSISTGKVRYADRFAKKMDMLKLFKFFLDTRIQDYSFFIFENYSYGGVGSIADLGELNGMFKGYLAEHNKPFDVIAPSSIKKIVAGSGRASKKEVKDALSEYIVNIDEITFNNLDESDACAIGVAYALTMEGHIDESKKN